MARRHVAISLLSLTLLACGADDGAPIDDGRFRVVIITDTHIAGPQYVCCSESPGIDNASIVRTEERLREVVRRINDIEPPPELVFLLGDAMHDPYYSTERAFYDQRTAFSDLRDILGELEVPVHIAWGNHDYAVDCDEGAYVTREFSHGLFRDVFATEPYHAVDHKGWRFVLANSMLGPTWEPGHPLCDTGKASYGAAQLAWIDEQLAGGLPTTVMAHYMLDVTQQGEDPDGPNPDLETVLTRHAAGDLVLTLVGHTHRFIDFADAYGFPHVVLPATRYDADNFWLLELDPANRSYRFLDYDKGRRLGACSDTWSYLGDPAYAIEQPAEDGDCG
jgi:3',5'-cyclic AMP phosphodiesterase CpdA